MSGGVWSLTALLGAVGAVLRVEVVTLSRRMASTVFAWGTFTVNVIGAFALGVLSGNAASHATIVVIGGGFLGSLTTFSAWMLDTDRALADGAPRRAALNVSVSLVAGVLAAWLGTTIG